jgi:hypothetical protein
VPSPDVYTAPDEGGAGTGLNLSDDLGRWVLLDDTTDPEGSETIGLDFFLPLILDGTSTYADNMAGCNDRFTTFGEFIPTGTTAMTAETAAGAAALVALDPGASWHSATNTVEGSCAPECAPVSPRLVALAVFDVDRYQFMRATNDWCPGDVRCVQVVNVVGFFIQFVTPNGIFGQLARYPGMISADYPSITSEASFLPTVTLVR